MLEVKEALRKLKIGKALGPNGIPIKVWKCMGDSLPWLTKIFNKTIRNIKKKKLDEWRNIIMVLIYKNKGIFIIAPIIVESSL